MRGRGLFLCGAAVLTALGIGVITGGYQAHAANESVAAESAVSASSEDTAATSVTSGTCGDNLTWKYENGTLTISGTGDMTKLPSMADKTDVKKIVVSDGVTKLAMFMDYTGVTSVELPSSLTTISDHGFNGCTSLTDIEIPEGVTSIGMNVFANCSSLANVSLPSTLTSIGDYAFYDCSVLESIDIPDECSSLGKHVFVGCSMLTNVGSPETLRKCGDTTTFEISDGVLTISGSGAIESAPWEGLAFIKKAEIADGVTQICSQAFAQCTGLADISIPSSVTTIGQAAFMGYVSLESVHIPDEVTILGSQAFEGCSNLKEVNIPQNINTAYEDGDGEVMIPTYLFAGCEKLESIEFPTTLKSIGGYAFSGCAGITEFNIPDSVVYIGMNAFEGCTGITSFSMPDSVTGIGRCIFDGCANLREVTLSRNLRETTQWPFGKCSSLITVSFPEASVCGENVTFKLQNGKLEITGDGDIEYIPWMGIDFVTEAVISENVSSLPNWSFIGCDKLASVTIQSTDVDIYDDCDTLGGADSTKIIGYANSTAKSYAKKYGYVFENIETGKITDYSIEKISDLYWYKKIC